MNIAVLNECFLSDRHVARLKRHGSVIIYKTTRNEQDAICRLKKIDVAVIHCSLLPIGEEIFANSKKLRYISLASTGFNAVDLEAAKKHGVIVSNLPTYGTESVAELAVGLMIATLRKIVVLDKKFREDPYEINSIHNLTTSLYVGCNLRGKTLGIIGLGRIGSRVAEIASGFGMDVVAYDIVSRVKRGVDMVSLNRLLTVSDVVTIHTLLDKTTRSLITARELKRMKKTSILVNTARGGIIDENDLYWALTNCVIAGAAIDTLENRNTKNPLLKLENIILTPHSAWYTDESFQNIADTVLANIEAYLRGKPINVIT